MTVGQFSRNLRAFLAELEKLVIITEASPTCDALLYEIRENQSKLN